MKRLILTFICLGYCLCGFSQTANTTNSQSITFSTPNYYQGNSILTIGGMKYKCESNAHWYSLERIYNTKIGERIMRKDGTPAPPNPYAHVEDIEDATQYWSRIRTVLADYRQELKESGAYLMVDYIMIPTGQITEVRITFDNTPLFCSIPPEKYVELEQIIRSELVFKWDKRTQELYDWLPGFLMIPFTNPSFY